MPDLQAVTSSRGDDLLLVRRVVRLDEAAACPRRLANSGLGYLFKPDSLRAGIGDGMDGMDSNQKVAIGLHEVRRHVILQQKGERIAGQNLASGCPSWWGVLAGGVS